MPTPVPETPILTTARLVLRPMALSDAAAVQSRFPRWEVVCFLNAKIPWPYPADGALAHIRDQVLPAVAAGRAWHWSIRPAAAPGELVGMIGLIAGDDDNRGFWLAPEWQGRGLMTEAVEAVNDFWFDVLGMPVLRVAKAVANTRSRDVSRRTGMRVVACEERDFLGGRQPAEIWEITAAEWAHYRGRA